MSFLNYYLKIHFFVKYLYEKNFNFSLLPAISNLLLSDGITDGVSRHYTQSLTCQCHVIEGDDMIMRCL